MYEKTTVLSVTLFLLSIAACKKAADNVSQISLTASTTTASVGETVTVSLSTDATASRWTVTPSTATKTYSITNSKVNYITFNEPGTYTVGVSAKSVALDSTSTHSLDSCWNSAKHNCVKDIDSTSVNITVTK